MPGAGTPAAGTGVNGPGALGGAGPYVTNPRGPTSRFELKIGWDFPSHAQKGVERDGRTTAVAQRAALSAAEAFASISGEDRRPLLVLRECLKCNGTDDALMSRQQDNERTLLMSRWFHCVKLPPDVLEKDHPYHALFAGEKPGHLFFARWDGSGRRDLTGQQSRTELWDLMGTYLASEYEKGLDGSLKQLLSLLDQYDRIDADVVSVKDQIDELIEKGQADSGKMRKLEERLAGLEGAKAKARAEAVKLSEAKLREQKPRKAAAAPPAGVGKG